MAPSQTHLGMSVPMLGAKLSSCRLIVKREHLEMCRGIFRWSNGCAGEPLAYGSWGQRCKAAEGRICPPRSALRQKHWQSKLLLQ